jgi:hypothetical protein
VYGQRHALALLGKDGIRRATRNHLRKGRGGEGEPFSLPYGTLMVEETYAVER